jgi:hypothetical protein
MALSDAGMQNRQNQIMQNWFRRKELVSPPYDKCGIFAQQDLEFHAGDLIGSERPQPDAFVIDAKQFRKAPDRCVWVRL